MSLSDTNPLDMYLDKFVNPLGDTPFLSDNDDENLDLWVFKPVVVNWTLKIVRSSVMVMFRMVFTDPYLALHQNVRVTAFEGHRLKYMLMRCVLHQQDESMAPYHFGIVVEIGQECRALFDAHGFIDELRKVQHGFLKWWEGHIHSWTNINQEDTVRRLGTMLSKLSESHEGSSKKAATKRKSASAPNLPPSSAASGPVTSAAVPAPSRKRLMNDAIVAGAAAPKKKKQKTAPTIVVSQVSGLTSTVNVKPKQKKEKSMVPEDEGDYVKFADLQTKFNDDYKSSFICDKEVKLVEISQLQRGKDTWVVRGLERDIIDNLKIYLGRLGDISQRQTIVITPIDNVGNLLEMRPVSWESIKDGKFAIIDGQHSVEASRELQHEPVNEKRKAALLSWPAYVVYDKDPKRLTAISEFYNTTNPLKHAQPTWGNQIVPGRSIWIDCGRPASSFSEHERRGNGATFNPTGFKVMSSIQD